MGLISCEMFHNSYWSSKESKRLLKRRSGPTKEQLQYVKNNSYYLRPIKGKRRENLDEPRKNFYHR